MTQVVEHLPSKYKALSSVAHKNGVGDKNIGISAKLGRRPEQVRALQVKGVCLGMSRPLLESNSKVFVLVVRVWR
jgi:hypothetical protein